MNKLLLSCYLLSILYTSGCAYGSEDVELVETGEEELGVDSRSETSKDPMQKPNTDPREHSLPLTPMQKALECNKYTSKFGFCNEPRAYSFRDAPRPGL